MLSNPALPQNYMGGYLGLGPMAASALEVFAHATAAYLGTIGLLTALLANGHALLVGVPGLAKTLLVSTVAEALDLDFSRVQFTPDNSQEVDLTKIDLEWAANNLYDNDRGMILTRTLLTADSPPGQQPAGRPRLFLPLRGQPDVRPPGEPILEIPG